MNNWKKEFLEIEHAIEEQERVINLVQSTKMYHVVEGVHNLKSKNDLFIEKKDRVGSSVKHMFGKTDKRIEQADALTNVKFNSQIVYEKIKTIQTEYEALLQYKEMYEKTQERICIEHKRINENVYALKKIVESTKCIGVMAPLESIDLPDGYSRRIKNIDNVFENDCLRVYMSKVYELDSMMPMAKIISEKYVSIKYNPLNKEHCMWIAMVAEKIGKVYIHSVYQSLEEIAKNKKIVKIFDFHGVVPEELKFMGNEEASKQNSQEEEILIRNTTYIIVANNAMQRHIMNKYPECTAKFILLPMNNEDNDCATNIKVSRNENQKPIIIYSGGLQMWQLISEMQDAIEKRREDYDFRMYVSDINGFEKLWAERKKPVTWRIETLPAEKLKEEYEKAQYGFVLRDDIVVNEVACPTKLIDYVKYGIVPIMKSNKIGDFVEKGLKYIAIDAFIKGKLPSENERIHMVENNLLVMDKIYDEYKKGIENLKKILKDI